MDKGKVAAEFLQKLADNPTDLVSHMMDNEMDPALVELFTQFGKKLEPGQIPSDSFKASLLIIGYLVRAHEETAAREQAKAGRPAGPVH